jgi:hypothetical protein
MNIIKTLSASALFLLATSFGHAVLTPIGPLDFASGAKVLDFSALADGADANGLILDAVLFQVTKNGVLTDGIVVVDGGPRTTGNITPPNLVSVSDINSVALIISQPDLALLSTSPRARHRSVAFLSPGFPIRPLPEDSPALLAIRHSIAPS